jgi:hypothetical protein
LLPASRGAGARRAVQESPLKMMSEGSGKARGRSAYGFQAWRRLRPDRNQGHMTSQPSILLRGSGCRKDALPWVVSDFSSSMPSNVESLKFLWVPVADDSIVGDQPTYRDLWLRIQDGCKKQGTEALAGERSCPRASGALHSLYGNYEYRMWKRTRKRGTKG